MCSLSKWGQFIARFAIVSFAMAAMSYGKGAPPAIAAFPGAEGAGAQSRGGRGGRVLAVTNLADDGPGSLREAIGSSGVRTIIFEVSGTIELKSDLVIEQPFVTIAGQTAPGDGVCLRNYPLRIFGTHDVIVRFLRVRPGDEAGKPLDGIEVRGSRDVIIDHCSVSWSEDEGINTWHGTKNVTVQWCLISEGLNRSSNYGPHAFGASWGGENSSYHHNLFAHCTARNPSVAGNHLQHTINMDHRCSVIYNWEHRTCDGKPVSCNVVNNYYKPGPATHKDVARRIVRIDETESKYAFKASWYIEGNVVDGAPEVTSDNWRDGVEFEPGASEALNRSRNEFPHAPVSTQEAPFAYRLVLSMVGATQPKRDSHDSRIIHEVETGTATYGNGIIDSQRQVGGWPILKSAPAVLDSDRDGMPDNWEKSHGLDAHDVADGISDPDEDGFSNLEEYLNRTDPKRLTGPLENNPGAL